jgi:hypothetical protein
MIDPQKIPLVFYENSSMCKRLDNVSKERVSKYTYLRIVNVNTFASTV